MIDRLIWFYDISWSISIILQHVWVLFIEIVFITRKNANKINEFIKPLWNAFLFETMQSQICSFLRIKYNCRLARNFVGNIQSKSAFFTLSWVDMVYLAFLMILNCLHFPLSIFLLILIQLQFCSHFLQKFPWLRIKHTTYNIIYILKC